MNVARFYDYPSARAERILRATEAEAQADIRSRNWMEDAARRTLLDVREHLAAEFSRLEDEQLELMRSRKAAGLDQQASEHALRARTHAADRELVRQVLDVDVAVTGHPVTEKRVPSVASREQVPDWAGDLLDALLTGEPLNFHGHSVPDEVRTRLDRALADGTLLGESVSRQAMTVDRQSAGTESLATPNISQGFTAAGGWCAPAGTVIQRLPDWPHAGDWGRLIDVAAAESLPNVPREDSGS